MNMTNLAHDLTEKGLVPDSIIRKGIRTLLSNRIDEIAARDSETGIDSKQQFVKQMNESPIALLPEKANEQHYEVPAEFFDKVLGSHLKYSCGYWPEGVDNLDESESHALFRTCQHAELTDGQKILELGCGWGSLTLWIAEHYPASHVTAVSNSHTQKAFILKRASERGLTNLEVITSDINDFDTRFTFDRVVSVEMFEHMRNYQELYSRISAWLNPAGKFFKHIFVHRDNPYAFDDKDETDWMSRHFFSGGMMPSDDLPLYFQDDLKLLHRWRWDGRHYEKTANAWLIKMDNRKDELWPLFENTYGIDFAPIWWRRWRVFFMACAELFGYNHGQEWWVSHYLFAKR